MNDNCTRRQLLKALGLGAATLAKLPSGEFEFQEEAREESAEVEQVTG